MQVKVFRCMAVCTALMLFGTGCSAMNGVDVGVRVPIGIGSVGASKTVGEGPKAKAPRGPSNPPAPTAPESSDEEQSDEAEDEG